MDCDSCDKLVEASKTDPKISDLLKEVENVFRTPVKLTCRPCNTLNEGGAKAFLVSGYPLEIVICTNKASVIDIPVLLRHELTHAYDYALNRCDFSTCKGLAYTEVRAARDGECANKSSIAWLKNQCIKSHAVNSTANIFPKQRADKCVKDVFDEAMKDTLP